MSGGRAWTWHREHKKSSWRTRSPTLSLRCMVLQGAPSNFLSHCTYSFTHTWRLSVGFWEIPRLRRGIEGKSTVDCCRRKEREMYIWHTRAWAWTCLTSEGVMHGYTNPYSVYHNRKIRFASMVIHIVQEKASTRLEWVGGCWIQWFSTCPIILMQGKAWGRLAFNFIRTARASFHLCLIKIISRILHLSLLWVDIACLHYAYLNIIMSILLCPSDPIISSRVPIVSHFTSSVDEMSVSLPSAGSILLLLLQDLLVFSKHRRAAE
jgi:hypothetical protein